MTPIHPLTVDIVYPIHIRFKNVRYIFCFHFNKTNDNYLIRLNQALSV